MHRLTIILLTLACGSQLAGPTPDVPDTRESELAEHVKTHINERMYETCKNVVLRHKADALFRGHAEFLNGVKVDLEVTVSDGKVEYRFLERPQPNARSMQSRLDDLQAWVAELEAEIARLTQLCLQAGIDVRPPLPKTDTILPEDSNDVPVDSTQEAPTAAAENAEVAVEEHPRFTWKVYEKIAKGMSYADIVAILDNSGHLISGSHFDDAENEVFVWANPDDSHICIVFRNGRVLVKTQFGLPETAATPTY